MEVAAGLLSLSGNLTLEGLTVEETNYNNLRETGFYIVNPNATNSPFTFWSIVLQVKMSNVFKGQLAFPMSGGETSLKYRVYDNGTWFPWKTISMT